MGTSDTEEAEMLVGLIRSDMKNNKAFRNGLTVDKIYEWYSSEIPYTKKQYKAKVLPKIHKVLDESPNFYKFVNRYGVTVWKLN